MLPLTKAAIGKDGLLTGNKCAHNGIECEKGYPAGSKGKEGAYVLGPPARGQRTAQKYLDLQRDMYYKRDISRKK